MKNYIIILIGALCVGLLFPVNMVVEPYLQNATPHSMHILWETDSDSPSIVEWGMYVFLTETTYGSSFSNYGNSKKEGWV